MTRLWNRRPGRRALLLLVLCLAAGVLSAAEAGPETDRAGALIRLSTAYSDTFWDDRCAFVRDPKALDRPEPKWSVRGTAWYAFGLLARDGRGDRERAARAIEAVLAQQIDAPGEPWNGTFYRSPEEPNPPPFARLWDDYDPNWRQFIGTTWALVLLRFPDRIPAPLIPRLEDSMRRAVEGELAQGRLKATYTNIALMQSFLQAYAGVRLGRPGWVRGGEAMAERIHDLYLVHGTFEEYNSPTYYGVDLYGLALWREFGPTAKLRSWGAEMEAGLWREIARYYHPGLRNLCGPYDRSYGMDMTRYVALTGLWMALVLDPADAPLPAPGPQMEHGHDLALAPLAAVLGARVPDDVRREFAEFRGERAFERAITPQRTATAWLSKDLMLGGEITHLSRAAGVPYSQFCPATIHWKAPDGSIGWVLLRKCSRVDARASANRLDLSAIGDAVFRISAAGLDPAGVQRDLWRLPGLTVRVETDATGFSLETGRFGAEAHYLNATRFVLRTEKIP